VADLEEGLLDRVGLDHAVAAQVLDQFLVGGAGAAPRHAGDCASCGASWWWLHWQLLMPSVLSRPSGVQAGGDERARERGRPLGRQEESHFRRE
jgi:hypothetical protein